MERRTEIAAIVCAIEHVTSLCNARRKKRERSEEVKVCERDSTFLTGMWSRTLAVAVALAVLLGGTGVVQALPTSITLTAGELGLGSDNINYAGNGSAVEADRPGILVTSTANNVGSILSIQADGTAGSGSLANPLLVNVTARAHLDVQTVLPADFDIYPGVITLTKDSGKGGKDERRGLGVRAFGLDLDTTSDNYGKRYVNTSYTGVNGHGFQMEGSKGSFRRH